VGVPTALAWGVGRTYLKINPSLDDSEALAPFDCARKQQNDAQEQDHNDHFTRLESRTKLPITK
jgi:hypothetical protein